MQPAVLKCDKLALKAIYSRSLKSAQDTASLIPSTAPTPDLYSEDGEAPTSFAALLARNDIAAVIIALPIVAQPAFVEAALAAGKHVLAEKPIAKDVASAAKLLAYARSSAIAATGATLSIAENMRVVERFQWAREQVLSFGRVTHFSARVLAYTPADSKYAATAWRKTPEYQGGFLLDGGVHFAAITRLLIGTSADSAPASVVAQTYLAQKHLAPIDSVSAVVTTRSGASGTYQHSAGSTLSSFDWDVAYEKGALRIADGKVTVTSSSAAGGEPVTREFERSSGVAEEVAAWAGALAEGTTHPLLSPEEALRDLEFLEKMFISGEQGGAAQTYELQ